MSSDSLSDKPEMEHSIKKTKSSVAQATRYKEQIFTAILTAHTGIRCTNYLVTRPAETDRNESLRPVY